MGRDIIDVYDRSIFEMKNVFTAEECQAFINYHEQSPNKQQGVLVGTEMLNRKKTTDVYIKDITNNLLKRYIEGLKKVHMEYTKHLNDIDRECGLRSITLGYPSALQIQRTDKGGFFKWHSDYYGKRLIAIIVYLNDIDEENGGSTEFNSGRKVQPEAGKVIMFPVTHLHLHKGNTILNGPSKYIITTFIEPSSISIANSLPTF